MAMSSTCKGIRKIRFKDCTNISPIMLGNNNFKN